jgi:Carboxypeptidase regulatory-like domain/TonB dependent receptor
MNCSLRLSAPLMSFYLRTLRRRVSQVARMNRLLPGVLVLVLSCASATMAQKDTGAIVGTVKDPGGAAVSGARVVVREADRGSILTIQTGEQGEYVASPLRVGRYTVAVEKEGFKKSVAGPVTLNVQDRLAVDVTLQLGAATETVTVTATDFHLDTETSDLGQVVDGRRATTLPLNGRNFAQLALLSAGVAPTEPGSRAETSFGFSSNGARSLQNNFLLDGVDNNANLGDLLNGSTYVIQPSVDAIGEFKVQTNAYTAEFGRGNGAILNAVIKSGTNGFHGDVYEFLRNDKLDGKNAFDAFGRQPYKQNQFGATFGGRIIKDRTFFFLDYEGTRIRQGLPQVLAIPTPAMVAGDFSSSLDLTTPIPGVLDCSGNATFQGEIFNTRLTQAAAGNPSGLCGVPIAVNGSGVPTNIFPSSGPSAINPVAARLAALFPAPNFNSNGNNFLTDPIRKTEQNNFDIRIDRKISQKDDIFGRVSYEDQPSSIPGPFASFLDGGGFTAGDRENAYRSVAISETHLFSQTLVNELRFGYNRVNSHRLQANSNTDVSGQLGLLGVPFSPGIGGLPSMCFTQFSCIGSTGFQPSIEKQNSYVFNENLTWIHGRHSLKFGTEIRREQFTIFQPSSPRGSLTFGFDFTNNPGQQFNADGSPTGGADFASFLLGIPDSANIVSLHNVDYHRRIYAGYGQDDIKVNSKLALNLGLRYEVFRPITEGHNQQATFDFASGSLILPTGQSAQLTPFLATILPINANGSRGLTKPDWTNVAPRVGVAYKITEKLVLRSGYGIFYGGQENGPFSNPSPGFNPPFFRSEAFNSQCGLITSNANSADPNNCAIGFGSPGNAQLINNFWTQGFPSGSLTDPNTPVLYSIDPHIKTPFAQQWHFGLQYQLPGETILDVSYGGSHGQRLFAFYNGNQAVTAIAPQFTTLCNDPTTTPPTTPANCPTAARRPFPAIDGNISTFRSNAYSNYHSLQARLEKRFSRGLQFEFSYTYSHALDDASSASLGSLNNGDFRDQLHPEFEYGNADFDVRHHFVASYIYELPFGRGKTFGRDVSGPVNQLIGNWQVSGIVSASTGNYFTVSDINSNNSTVDCAGTVTFNCSRPNLIGNPNGKPCVAGTYFNTCAFASNTAIGTFGNAGRNIVRGPGYQDWDFSIFKTFPIREQMRFEFRAEFFNIWNHVNPLTGPTGQDGQVEPVSVELGQAQFGFVQAARDPRFIQFALKFYF